MTTSKKAKAKHLNDDRVDAFAAVVIILAITAGIIYWLWSMPT